MFGVQDILAILLAAAALWYVVRFMRRAMSGKGGCHCDKGTPCNSGSKSGGSDESGNRRLPLVSLSPAAGNKADPVGASTPSLALTETTPSPVPKPK